MKNDYICNKCGGLVEVETIVGEYSFFCPACQENLFSFEVTEKIIKLKSMLEEKRDVKLTLGGIEDVLLDIYEDMIVREKVSFVDIEIIIKIKKD